ncbi:MAG TPA: DUF5691 domain-containing protein [Ktedonobacterales bacterium]|nr:DUF5691 domain-containing protein [Ktedonobacterales bacterium]
MAASNMDGLVTLALVGTARHRSSADTATHTPIDDLTSTLAAAEPERALLLRAGALAVYRQAGQTAPAQIGAPTPAPSETRPLCSPGAAALLGRLLKEENILLPEALARLNRAGQRLPFDLLPDALNIMQDEHRKLLAPVLGERGRWLSHFHTEWDWVEATLIELAGELPPDAEDIWQEGKLNQRVALLRQARQFAPERARDWVEGVWKQEKADTREKLIDCYEINLSPEDEAFLEAALDDRAQAVRATAIRLLMGISTSAFAARAIARADAVLDYANGKLVARPPKDFPAALARDGLPVNTRENQKGKGPRATWLTVALAQVNPTHWQERFGLSPDALIEAVGEKNEWEEAIRDGWTQAAQAHQATAWMLPLWRWRHAVEANAKHYSHSDYSTGQLMGGVAAEERRRLALDMLRRHPLTADDSSGAQQWNEAVNSVLAPWDDEFSQAYLAGLYAFAGQLTAELLAQGATPVVPWLETLAVAQVALAPSCVGSATRPFDLPPMPEGKLNWQLNYAHRQLGDFTNTMRLRQRLIEELPD